MKVIMDDMLETIKRLNEELSDRTNFEHKLIDIITAKNEEIEDLKNQLKIYVDLEEKSKLKDEIKAQMKVEETLNKVLNTEPLVKPKDLTITRME